jgi:hypothetical protein
MAAVNLWTLCHVARLKDDKSANPEDDLCEDCFAAWDSLGTMLSLGLSNQESASAEALTEWGNAFSVISNLRMAQDVSFVELQLLSERYDFMLSAKNFESVAQSFGFSDETIGRSRTLIERGLLFSRMSTEWRKLTDMWFAHLREVKPDESIEVQFELARAFAMFFQNRVQTPDRLREYIHFGGDVFEELFGAPLVEFCTPL